MKNLISILSFLALWATPSWAQLQPPNAAGVTLSQWSTIVRDVDAAKKFWVLLGGTAIKVEGIDVVKFPGVFVFLTKGEPAGGNVGSTIDHLGMEVPNGEEFVAKLRAAGVKMDPTAGTKKQGYKGPSWGNVYSPDEVKITILDATVSTANTAKQKYAPEPISPLAGAIMSDHVHFYVLDSTVKDMRAWYAKLLGAKPFPDPVPNAASPFAAIGVPGLELIFGERGQNSPAAAPGKAPLPTQGRALDGIGFEVKNLKAFCKRLQTAGVKFDKPYSKSRHKSYASAQLTDPWGTSIELTEGLNKL